MCTSSGTAALRNSGCDPSLWPPPWVSGPELRRLLELVAEDQERFEEAWDEFFRPQH